jgi:acetolactate synthase-1/2/3 large subunit
MAIYYHAPEFGIRRVTMRAETDGAMIADGYARVSRKVGVIGAMGGPGAALLVPGLLEAMNASCPSSRWDRAIR